MGTGKTRRSLIATAALVAFVALGPASGADAGFGFRSLSSSFSAAGGDTPVALPAGSHPDAWFVSIGFDTVGKPDDAHPDGSLRNLAVALPQGAAGAFALRPRCGREDFLADTCPGSAAVGSLSFDLEESQPPATIYLLDPLPGRAARLGFHVKHIPVSINLGISPDPPHHLIATIANASQVADLFGATLTLAGSPGGVPFLTLPRSCGPLITGFAANSWQEPNLWMTALAPAPQETVDCASLDYGPSLSIAPTTSSASAPSGLDIELGAPDDGISSVGERAAADTRSATLELPPGLTLNPPLAQGLKACTSEQLAEERADADPATGCPEAAKIGAAEVVSPLLDQPIGGNIYVAEPDDPATSQPGRENPFDSLLALYLVFREPERGVLLSLPIRIDADSRTGRLTARLDRIPELPLSHVSLRFNAGPHAPLSTPAGCGTQTISYALAPSSGNAPLRGGDTFPINSGCSSPFAPRLVAGTASASAGAVAPFVFDLAVSPESTNLGAFRLALPAGVGVDLTAAETCPETEAAQGACPPQSRLGNARVALGTGPEPLWVPAKPDSGSVFLAGPYLGAPFSLVLSFAAAAGPFDLGRIVVRAPVYVDPNTARASIEIADLPQIVAGIPLRYRAIRLLLDRPGLIRNPTSCEPRLIELTARSADGAIAGTSAPFQADGCGALRFRPRLTMRFSETLGRNGHPRIGLRFHSRPGEANLAGATFDLPAAELLDFRRIRALCPRDHSGRCPAASRLGWAEADSPLLREPLRGPIFLRAPSGRYPDLVASLHSGGIRLLLQGRTASARGGRLRVHLGGIPDFPLSRVAITLAGGLRGIVVNSASLCGRSPRGAVLLQSHNRKERRLRPRVLVRQPCDHSRSP
jgi:hypothetical protein